MIDDSSRYANVGTAVMITKDADGTERKLSYLKRRQLPPLAALDVVGEHVVREDERLDTLTALYFRDPTLYFRICDANLQFSPTDLTAKAGRRLLIATPKP